MGLSQSCSQPDREQILELRNTSNLALKANNLEKVLSFLTDDLLLTPGHGNMRSGKEVVRDYTSQGNLDKSF